MPGMVSGGGRRVDDLQSLDPGLYKGLVQVKHYEGDVEASLYPHLYCPLL